MPHLCYSGGLGQADLGAAAASSGYSSPSPSAVDGGTSRDAIGGARAKVEAEGRRHRAEHQNLLNLGRAWSADAEVLNMLGIDGEALSLDPATDATRYARTNGPVGLLN